MSKRVIELQPGESVTVARNFDVIEIVGDAPCEHMTITGELRREGVREFACETCGATARYELTRRA